LDFEVFDLTLFFMKVLLLFLLLSLLFISQINTIIDIDLWWNLKAGECIIENLEVPRVDIFSYTLGNTPWIDHEWLSQVIFYFIFSSMGWLGLNLLKALLIALSFLILFFFAYSRDKKILFPFFFLLFSILTFGYRSVLRPEIFSYLLLCIFLYILEKGKGIAILPFLQILWVNLHGYFILGPIVVFLYAIGEFFHGDRLRARKTGLVLIFLILGCFVSPYFYRGAFYPIRILLDVFGGQKLLMQNIHELQMPMAAGFYRYMFFWFFAILTSISFILNLQKVKLSHILIFALTFIASYKAARNIPIFIFPAMFFASINLNAAPLTKRLSVKKNYVVFVLLACGFIYFFISNKYYVFMNQYNLRRTESRFSRFFMPSGACDFLEKNNIKGRMFNTLDFGPYIGYRFYPEKRIFIDTRTDLYKDDFYRSYARAQNYPGEWEKIHAEYGFNIAVIRHVFSGTERILKYLYRHRDWRLVYYDENSCIFLNNVQENAEAIDRFEIDLTGKEIKDPDLALGMGILFEKLEKLRLAEQVYLKLLQEDPTFLEAGNNLASIYINTGRTVEGIELLKRFLEYYPKSAELYANMGTAYLHLGRKQEGFAFLKRALEIEPYYRKASYFFGIIYLEGGEIDKAMKQFIKYSTLDPYDAEAHRIMGDIYTQKGLLKQAETEYNEANALDGI